MRAAWVLVLLAFTTNGFAESLQCDGVDVSVQYKEMDPPSASGWEQVTLRVRKDNKRITKQYEYVHFKIGCWANPKGKQYIVYQAYCGGSASYCNHENNWGIIDPVLTKALLDPSPDNRRKAETIFGGTLRWEQWSEQSGARPNLVTADASRGGVLRDSFAGPTLLVDGKSVTYRKAPEGAPLAQFQFETKGYRNTYTLDCSRRQFLWTNNVELATGQSTANTAGAQWRPITGDSKVARVVFLAVCNELGITGSLDEIFPTRDFGEVLDRTDCVDRCEMTVGGWKVELTRVVADDRGTPAFTLTDAGGQCGMGGCKALFLKRGGYWDHIFEVGGTLFDVLPTRTDGLADLRVRTLGDAGWTNVRYAWSGKQYVEAEKRDQQSEDRTAGPPASATRELTPAGKAAASALGRSATEGNRLVEALAA